MRKIILLAAAALAISAATAAAAAHHDPGPVSDLMKHEMRTTTIAATDATPLGVGATADISVDVQASAIFNSDSINNAALSGRTSTR